jgi:DNA (cytosine-5)-methyltransferase 1
MDYKKETKQTLIARCKELGIRGYSGKTKQDLIDLLSKYANNMSNTEPESILPSGTGTFSHLNHISSYSQNLSPELPNVIQEKEEQTDNQSTNLKFIDLFCGIGGFHQALNRIGATCVFACDIDEQCRKTYERNYGLKPHGDISKLNINAETIPEFDILCAGFPCQSFSNSGKKGGLEDKRGKLFEYILQIAALRNPRFLFLENVKHIMKIDDGKVFEHILKRIRETGYEVHTIELSPHEFGVPQQRERVVFICVRRDIYMGNVSAKFVVPNTPIDLSRIIETDTTKTAKYRISKDDEAILSAWDEMVHAFDVGESMSPTILCNEFYTTYTEEEFAKLPEWKRDYKTKNRPLYEKYKTQWDEWYKRHETLIKRKEIYGKLEWQVGKKKAGDSIFNQFIQFRQSGIRVKKCEYFPTLVAIVQTPIYAKERRHITPRECARLQSFPDDFVLNENDHTAYKQFGNAVNVDVVHFVIYNTLVAYGVLLGHMLNSS